jgi:small-conductance mechanosensitive channel
MQEIVDLITESLTSGIFIGYENIRPKLLSSLLIIILLWFLRLIVLRIAYQRIESVSTRYWWKKVSTYVAVVLGVTLVGPIWMTGIQSLATFLGLVAAGLAIALQSPITDLAGWGFVMWRRPFEVGDRIQVGDRVGDVIDVRIFQFSLLEIGNWVDADQSTGRIMHVPNKMVFDEVITNYSQGFRYVWNEIPVLVTFESNWETAKAILQEIVNRHAAALSGDAGEQFRQAARRFMIEYATTLDPMVYTRVEESGVLLTLRYLCEYHSRRSTEHVIWEDILQAFAQESDVEFAYPTHRFYNDWVERRGQAGDTHSHAG